MDIDELRKFCMALAENLQQENSEIEIVFVSQKDMWFNLSCEYDDKLNNTNLELNSKVDISVNDTQEIIEKKVLTEIKNILSKKNDLEDKNARI